ncbi:MAG: ParB N-terminal domain-containing protein [Ignavibacteria bacterium]
MSILAGEKFELKLIRASDILLHEECEDNRYGRLVERFEQEKVLYNPLIVGRFNDQFVLIDGANRFEALKRTGCKVILAQLVSYSSPEVRLRSWYHFVNEIMLDELKGFLQASGIGFECIYEYLYMQNPVWNKMPGNSRGKFLCAPCNFEYMLFPEIRVNEKKPVFR